jgi:hypothetical protein
LNITVTDICSFNTKFNKMEEYKNLEQNLDKSNEKLHISDVNSSHITLNKEQLSKILREVISEYSNGYDVLTKQESDEWTDEIFDKHLK